MGQITRISTRDYRTTPQFPFGGPSLPRHYTKTGTPTSVEILREHTDLIENDNSVIVAYSQLLRGTTKSGKKWTRWNDVKKEILTVKPNKNGAMRVNFLKVDRKGFRNYTPYDAMHRDFFMGPATHAIRALLDRKVPDRSQRWTHDVDFSYAPVFYPGLLFSNIRPNLAYINKKLRISLREENAMDMATAAFGKKHYRKDLVKSMAECTVIPNIEMAINIRSLMKTDWLVEMMRLDGVLGYGSALAGPLMGIEVYLPQVLAYIPEHRRRRFILSFADHNRTFNTDAVSMGTRMTPETIATIRTVGEMHEIGVANRPQRFYDGGFVRATIEPPKPFDITLTDRAKMYDGLETEEGLRILAPKDSTTVESWSAEMNNCIRSYAHLADGGKTNLGGVYDGEKLIANFEIDPSGNLKQLLGKYNSHLDVSQQSDIIDSLEECGAITDLTLKHAWGVDLIVVPDGQ